MKTLIDAPDEEHLFWKTAGGGATDMLLPSPAPLPPLEAEFERLRKLLRQNHQVVGMRLRELAEAQHRDGWPDHSAFKTALVRLSNETREMEQLLLNIQLATAFPIPKGVIHEHGTAKLKRHL